MGHYAAEMMSEEDFRRDRISRQIQTLERMRTNKLEEAYALETAIKELNKALRSEDRG